jgi:hypothetical protein
MTVDGPAGDVDFDGILVAHVFACTTCGRADLPEAGDWDPPICQECDAAINFDTLLEEMDQET